MIDVYSKEGAYKISRCTFLQYMYFKLLIKDIKHYLLFIKTTIAFN